MFNKCAILFSLSLVLLAGFWLRTTQLEQYPPGISNDEAKNLIDSAYIAQTGRTPFYQDEGRPEPVNRLITAIGSILYGNSVWAFRLISTFWGILTLAATYWSAKQCFFDTSARTQHLAAIFATIALAIALGHITVTRSLYRAVPLPFFTLLMIGFTARGLRTYRWKDFLWIGVCLALGIYTYTSGFITPVIFIPLGLFLLITRFQHIKQWLPRLLLSGVVLALLTSPVIYLLLTQPSAVLARAADVAEARDIGFDRKVEQMIGQFFTEGDENPQYNVANAPLLAEMMIPFFFLGFLSLLIRWRQPSSILIVGLLFLNLIPVLLTDEITHGLRIYSQFAILPLIIGASFVLIFTGIEKLSRSNSVYGVGLFIILAIGSYHLVLSHQTYISFWEEADTEWRKWSVYDRELTHNEWFFRSDRKVLTDWIKDQSLPLLIPVEELTRDAQRGMLMSYYPTVKTAPSTFQLPQNTQIIIPWSLETGDFLKDEHHYALLNQGIITMLPPLTDETLNSLMSNINDSKPIEYPNSNIPVVGKVFLSPENLNIRFQQPKLTSATIAIFNNELEIEQWYGENTISTSGEYVYTLNWSVNRPVSHEYGAFLQVLTQDWERIDGQDKELLRWLYPTIAWQPDQLVPETFTLDIPDSLPTGAYRLVAGAWYVNGGRMPATSFVGETTNDIATIGWLKVPQDMQPEIPAGAIDISVSLNNLFQLSHATIGTFESEKLMINLFWKSLVHRPNIDATVFVHAIDSNNTILSQSDIRPWNGQYPTFIWDEDEIIVTEHVLDIQNIDDVQLIAGMYTQPDFVRLPAMQNGEPLADNLIRLGTLSELLGD